VTEPQHYHPPLILTLDAEGVNLNMDFICPACGLTLHEHDVEVFSEQPAAKIRFTCLIPEVDETTIP
jgi:hypothetical protein